MTLSDSLARGLRRMLSVAGLTALTLPTPAQQVRELLSATEHGLSAPEHLFVDRQDNVWVGDNRGGLVHVYRVDPDGQASEVYVGPTTRFILFPNGDVVVDHSGNLVLYDSELAAVVRVSPEGRRTVVTDVCCTTSGTTISGIEVGPRGTVYVATHEELVAIDPDGQERLVVDLDVLVTATGAAMRNFTLRHVDARGNIYLCAEQEELVLRLDPNGDVRVLLGPEGAGPGAPLNNPRDVTVDSAGNVFVVGMSSRNVLQVDPAGVVTERVDWTGDGGGHELLNPTHLAVDDYDNVFVTGAFSDNLFKLTPAGEVSLVLEGATSSGVMLDNPKGVTVDGRGRVWVLGGASDNLLRLETSSGTRARNGRGLNPRGLRALTQPILGASWTVHVEPGPEGLDLSVLRLSEQPLGSLPLAIGELLLAPPYLLTSVVDIPERPLKQLRSKSMRMIYYPLTTA